MLSQWECSNPSYITLQVKITAKKQIWGALLQKPGSRLCPSQGKHNHRAKGRLHSISMAALTNTTSIKPPFKGIIPQGSGQISPTRGQTPEATETMILEHVEKRPQHNKSDKMRKLRNTLQMMEQEKTCKNN